MPLDRAHTTIGGWTAARLYPPFTAIVGLSFILTDPARLRASPGLDYAARFVPLDIWGAGFLLVGIALAAALLLKNRRLYLLALPCAMLWLGVWAILLLAAAFDGATSYSAWAWPGVIVGHMWAVQLSLESNQVDADGRRNR